MWLFPAMMVELTMMDHRVTMKPIRSFSCIKSDSQWTSTEWLELSTDIVECIGHEG